MGAQPMGTPRAVVEGCLTGRGGPFQIPFSAILPRTSEALNLLVPVALSASHVAFSSIRLEITWMVLGQSAGIAAARGTGMGGTDKNVVGLAIQSGGSP